MRSKDYRLLVFDWDGTLIDSAAKIVACLHLAIKAAQLPAREDAQLRHIIGLGIEEAIDYLFPEGISASARLTLIQEYRQQYLFTNRVAAPLFAGVIDTLETLSRQGYYLAIATGKSRSGLDKVLKELEMEHYFHISRCADETRSKPHPQMLLEILTDLDMSASEALMIGDTQFDIQMAQQARVDALAVSQGAHTLEQLEKVRPLAILESVIYLLSWLDGSNVGKRPG